MAKSRGRFEFMASPRAHMATLSFCDGNHVGAIWHGPRACVAALTRYYHFAAFGYLRGSLPLPHRRLQKGFVCVLHERSVARCSARVSCAVVSRCALWVRVFPLLWGTRGLSLEICSSTSTSLCRLASWKLSCKCCCCCGPSPWSRGCECGGLCVSAAVSRSSMGCWLCWCGLLWCGGLASDVTGGMHVGAHGRGFLNSRDLPKGCSPVLPKGCSKVFWWLKNQELWRHSQ